MIQSLLCRQKTIARKFKKCGTIGIRMLSAQPEMLPLQRNPSLDFRKSAYAAVDESTDWLSTQERPPQWWTGAEPTFGKCAGVLEDGTMTSLAMPSTESSREEVMAYFENTWALTEVLFAGLKGEDSFVQLPYHRLRHPMLFYYGHVACLYVNKLRVAHVLDSAVDPYFEELFETGVDEMSWDDLPRVRTDWPEVKDVLEYRRKVYNTVRDVIMNYEGLYDAPPGRPCDGALWSVLMGCEHDRIHLETSSVLMRELPLQFLMRPSQWPADAPTAYSEAAAHELEAGMHYPVTYPAAVMAGYGSEEAAAPGLVSVEPQAIEIGKEISDPAFGWDNEFGRKKMTVGAFEAGQHLVTNGDFHKFVSSGGYHNKKYWSDDSWGWREHRNVKWPTFWVSDGPQGLNEFCLRTLWGCVPMPWAAPAEVNHHEAAAYCNWLEAQERKSGGAAHRGGWRPILEAEHRALQSPPPGAAPAPAGDRNNPIRRLSGADAVGTRHANFNLGYGTSSDVDAMAPNARGANDVHGNVWQWTNDWFAPLDDSFEPHRVYPDFSTPCFDNAHRLILGGSWASTGDLASVHARYHFRPHYYQHAGFRIARSVDTAAAAAAAEAEAEAPSGLRPAPVAAAPALFAQGDYEDDALLSQYLALHFDQLADGMNPHLPAAALQFPQRCAQTLMRLAAEHGVRGGRALDLGCAVGGSSFELTRLFKEVVGLDFSHAFIDAAQSLQRGEALSFTQPLEGSLVRSHVASLPAELESTAGRASFVQGDACALPADMGRFQAILMANLMCRLPDPAACIDGVSARLDEGGILMVTSPYSWFEQYTAPEKWVGGRSVDGCVQRSRECFLEMMGTKGMELKQELEMPLLIPEHARKYQFILAHTTVWQKQK